MANLPASPIRELDFDVARENFLDFVKTHSEFGDYDFESSGLNFLVDLLAYNTQYNAFYLNQLSSEMFLDTAQQRRNVVSIAKQMGYISQSKKAGNAKINMQLERGGSLLPFVNMNSGTRFIGKTANGKSLPFITKEEYTFKKSSNYEIENVELIQGRYVSQTIVVNQLQLEPEFLINSRDIDLEFLTVFVKETASSTKREKYNIVEDITLIDENSPAFFIEENYDGFYKIMFGDGVIGKKIKNNNVIEMNYLVTSGADGNDCISFSLSDEGALPLAPIVSLRQASAQGSNREDIETIRINARKNFFSQNRTVTEGDYDILLRKKFNYIDSISIWGGEKNEIPMYGTVYCAIKPKDKLYLSEGEKTSIYDYLNNLNMISIIPKIVDPEYIFIRLDVTVAYDVTNIEIISGEISNIVREKIEKFIQENLLKFSNSFQIPTLEKEIGKLNEWFLGIEVQPSAYQKIKITTKILNSHKINFNNSLMPNSLETTRFVYDNIENCTIIENNGILEVHQILNETKVLNKDTLRMMYSETNIINSDVGSIDNSTGMIKVENFIPDRIMSNDGSSDMSFDVKLGTKFIKPKREQILFVTSKDIEVETNGMLTNS